MICPQCGDKPYSSEVACKSCGFHKDNADDRPPVQIRMNDERRDVMNGVGLGCTTLAVIWFFVESLVFAFAAHDPRTWSYYGPLLEVSIPILIVGAFYLILRRSPSNFSKGVGYSLIISLIIFLIGGIALHATDNKPPSNAAHSEGF